MLHFGLAYYLQQKLNADFYAIIDVSNRPKKFFLNQTMVTFQQSWYFHDHIKKTISNPDLSYLSSFEKRYHIDLWKLAINERHFYRFNRFYKFTTNEILQFLEQECKLFEQILDEVKPDYFLTYDPPFHHHKLMLDLCKAKNIRVLCMYFARIGGKTIIDDDGDTFNLPSNLDEVELTEIEKTEIEKNFFKQTKNDSDYSVLAKKYKNERGASTTDKLKALVEYTLFSDSRNMYTNYTYYGRSKFKVILDSLSLAIKRKSRLRFIENTLTKNVNLDIPFIYFPMNVEEELSILHYSPFYTNQIEVIRHIAKSIPVDYKLYVKDHIFSEFRGWHDIREYQEIMDIPNVILIHPSYSSSKLIKHSKLVITIRGTASFDAAFENKPSIVFSKTPFSILPSVYTVNSLNELPMLIRTALKNPVNQLYLQKYIKIINERSVDFNMMDFEVKRNQQFYSGNILSDVEISEKDTKEFFAKNEAYFKSLVNAHLEKIR